MSNTWSLVKAQLLNFSRINEVKSSTKQRITLLITMIGILYLIGILSFYNATTASILIKLGLKKLVPAFLVAVSSYSIFFMSIPNSNGVLFSGRDMNILFALPVKNRTIIYSKFIVMYLINLFIVALFMIPGGIIWLMNSEYNLFVWLIYFISIFIVPLIPMCFASIVGIMIVYAASFFKNKNIFGFIFSFAALGLIGYLMIFLPRATSDIFSLSVLIANQITRIYPLSNFFMHDMESALISNINLFLLLSVIVFYLFTELIAKNYLFFHGIVNAPSRYVSHRKFERKHSVFSALYRKELGRFLSSYMAVLNAGMGIILLSIASIFFLFSSLEFFNTILGIGIVNDVLADYSPLIISMMIIMSCPAASSISLEGKNVWILQSSPISVRTILNAKIAVNLSLHAIGYIMALIALIIKLNLSPIQLVTLMVVPICYSLFISVIGVSINKKHPNYTWENEMMVVKQSLPVLLSMIIGTVSVLIPFFLTFNFGLPVITTLWIVAIALIGVTLIVYLRITKAPLY